jgi:hypothetical protein
MARVTLTEDPDAGVYTFEATANSREGLAKALIGAAATLTTDLRRAAARSLRVGSANYRAKHTEEEVWTLAAKVWAGASMASVAREHGVNYGWLVRVIHGQVWPHIRERGVREGLVS